MSSVATSFRGRSARVMLDAARSKANATHRFSPRWRSAGCARRSPRSRRSQSDASGCPGNHESAGKCKSGNTRKGPKWLGVHLAEAASAAGRSKGTYLRDSATASQAVSATRRRTRRSGTRYSSRRDTCCRSPPPTRTSARTGSSKRRPEAHTRRLVKQIEALGFSVTIVPTQAA